MKRYRLTYVTCNKYGDKNSDSGGTINTFEFSTDDDYGARRVANTLMNRGEAVDGVYGGSRRTEVHLYRLDEVSKVVTETKAVELHLNR